MSLPTCTKGDVAAGSVIPSYQQTKACQKSGVFYRHKAFERNTKTCHSNPFVFGKTLCLVRIGSYNSMCRRNKSGECGVVAIVHTCFSDEIVIGRCVYRIF